MHKCAPVSYEWDPAKARANFTKHGVRFADAVTLLEDDLALTIRDPSSDEEERWITLGRNVPLHRSWVNLAWRECASDFSASDNGAREEPI